MREGREKGHRRSHCTVLCIFAFFASTTGCIDDGIDGLLTFLTEDCLLTAWLLPLAVDGMT